MSFSLCNNLCNIEAAIFDKCCGVSGVCARKRDDTGVLRDIIFEDSQIIVIRVDPKTIEGPDSDAQEIQCYNFDLEARLINPPKDKADRAVEGVYKEMIQRALTGRSYAIFYIQHMVTYQAIASPVKLGNKVIGGCIIIQRKKGAIYFSDSPPATPANESGRAKAPVGSLRTTD